MSETLDQVVEINIYLQPIQFILSIVLNIITIYILSSYTLRASSCSYYLLAYAVFALMYMIQICPGKFFLAFNITLPVNEARCRLATFTINFPPILTRHMLLLASWDRFCSSSTTDRFRLQRTVNKAKRNILIAIIVTIITMLPTLIIYYANETVQLCLAYTDRIALAFIFVQILYVNVLAPLFMTIFGCLTIYNIRQSARRVRTEQHHQIVNHRTEGQLARMLILQIFVLLITNIPYIIIYSIVTINPSAQTSTMNALRNISVFLVQSQYYISFFLYIISGRIYRQELLKTFKKCQSRNSISFY